jgi:hypothetical protein
LWNALLVKALAVVRQSNPTRPVIVGPTRWNSITMLPLLKLPADPNLIVTVHFYDPFTFTHQGAGWVNPSPPTGTRWDGSTGSLAAGWANWSWDSDTRFVREGLEVHYKKSWAGLYLHHDIGVQGFDSLALKINRAVLLNVSCVKDKGYTLTTVVGLNLIPLAQCGNPTALTDLMIQNAADGVQEPVVISGLELRGSSKNLSLFGNELEQVRSALKTAADWGKANRRPIFLGEFGAYEKADPDSRVRWTGAVRAEAEKLGLSWAYWEFGAGFGIYNRMVGEWRKPLLKALVP